MRAIRSFLFLKKRIKWIAFAALCVFVSGLNRSAAGVEVVNHVPKRLNNFVVELLSVGVIGKNQSEEYKFVNTREGWVFISAEAGPFRNGEMVVAVDSAPEGESIFPMSREGEGPLEAMRFLSAGEHRLAVRAVSGAGLKNLVVRAIPEIAFCKFQYNPHVTEYGPYDWEYLGKHVLGNVNTIVGSGDAAHEKYMREWKRRGGKWMIEYGVPGLAENATVTVDEAYKYWTENPGFQNPLMDGLLADEFLDRPKEKYDVWAGAVKRISGGGKFRGKYLYPYWGPSLYSKGPAEFAKAVTEAGYKFAHELYLKEQPDERTAKYYLESTLKLKMKEWKAFFPNAADQLLFALGYMSAPPESLNTNPSVDYKVWMDMQLNYLANDPVFKGLFGVLEYTSGYADEEIVRWASKLYRHYCIEGKKERLTDDPYILRHIENPDFKRGTEGWTLSPAEPGSMEAGNMKGYAWLQGRYPSSSEGDSFLRTKRSAAGPNIFSQEVKGLRPGRLYSLKMYTADYGELARGKSVRQKHAVSIKIEGATPAVAEKSFQHVFANCYGHAMGPFNDDNRAWMNYHQRIFRAMGETAKLMISDWAGEDEPGGEVGQELMFNFVEVEPYVEN